jgi:hypothetical protein
VTGIGGDIARRTAASAGVALLSLTFGSAAGLPSSATHAQGGATAVCVAPAACAVRTMVPPPPSPSPFQTAPGRPTPRPTAVPLPMPTVPPTATAAPPPVTNKPPAVSGYFSLLPVGSWSSLPSDAQCAAAVHSSSWEPRSENRQQNTTMPAPGAMAASFAARPRDRGETYNPRWDSWLLPRVDGRFTGTTDEILQWAACKWGLPDNLLRADAVIESTWFQYLHFSDGSCYWDYGCGDAFSSATSASTTYCAGLASSGGHDYQTDPVTKAGGYPYTPRTGMCPQTFSILGVMSWDNPAWEAPYPAYPGDQNGTFPFTRDSTAAAADYWGAYIRGCYEGWETWLGDSGTKNYGAGDLWGCVGSWYDGAWHDSAAGSYIAKVQNAESSLTWLKASFDDASQQYDCDPAYGCPR